MADLFIVSTNAGTAPSKQSIDLFRTGLRCVRYKRRQLRSTKREKREIGDTATCTARCRLKENGNSKGKLNQGQGKMYAD